jgi:hypothetical protein
MAKLLKLRRGTTSQHGSFTGAEGEVTVDTDKETLVVHDGSTAGGHPVAAEDLANVSSATIAGRLSNDSIATSKIAGGTLPSDVNVVSANLVNGTVVDNDLANDAVTFAKMQNIATAQIIGRSSSGTGDPESLSASDVRTLINVENGATADQSAAEIRTLVESASDSNVFTDADHSKLNGIEASATADQSNAEIRAAVEAATDSNVFTDADHSKLNGIEASATADQTDAQIRAAVEAASDSNVFTDADHTKLNAIAASANNYSISSDLLDQDNMSSNSATKVPSQQSVKAYVDNEISSLVDSSPGALNTLNELAAAVNDDANFSTTITNSIATKMPLAGGEFTGNVTCENITPDGDSSRNLGTNSVRFATIYADSFVGSGANLTGVEAFVSGMIILWSGSTGSIPSGFVLCNGSNSTPDLRDRFVIGAGNSYSVGATGGSANVTLTTAQLPAHSHSTNNHTHSFNAGNHSHSFSTGNHTHSFSGSGSSNHSHGVPSSNGHTGSVLSRNRGTDPWTADYNSNSVNTANASVSLSVSGNTGNASSSGNTGNASPSGTTGNANPSTNNTGSGNAHENRPPYYALCYIMKT